MKVINNFLQEVRSFGRKNSVKAIVKHGDLILLLRRQNDHAGEGQWDLPGGAIEESEKPMDALKREVFEETNLKIENIKRLTSTLLKIPETGIESMMTIFICNSPILNVTLKQATWKGADGKPEHTEYKWISKKTDLQNIPMLPCLKTVVMKELL